MVYVQTTKYRRIFSFPKQKKVNFRRPVADAFDTLTGFPIGLVNRDAINIKILEIKKTLGD